jgi:predicted nucleic acid-binding protein
VRRARLKKAVVLDSYAVLAFLFDEQGAEIVAKLFEEAADDQLGIFLSAVNWAETQYIIERKVGAKKWKEARNSLLSLPIEIVPADQSLAELAAEIKATNSMSLADCFAAALARHLKAQLVTGDKEFKQVEADIRIRWI